MFRVPVTLTFDLPNPKSIGSILDPWGVYQQFFMILGKGLLELSSKNESVTDGRTDERMDGA